MKVALERSYSGEKMKERNLSKRKKEESINFVVACFKLKLNVRRTCVQSQWKIIFEL